MAYRTYREQIKNLRDVYRYQNGWDEPIKLVEANSLLDEIKIKSTAGLISIKKLEEIFNNAPEIKREVGDWNEEMIEFVGMRDVCSVCKTPSECGKTWFCSHCGVIMSNYAPVEPNTEVDK